MTDDHKAALAVGRTEGRAVRRYLDALEANKPKRGRKRTPDSIQRRLKAIDAELADTDRLNELKLVQERMIRPSRHGCCSSGDSADSSVDFPYPAAATSSRHDGRIDVVIGEEEPAPPHPDTS